MEGCKVEIRQVKREPISRELYLNGHKLPGVRKFSIECGVNEIPTLHLDTNLINCTIDGDMLVFDELSKQGIKDIIFEDEPPVKDGSEN